MFSPHKHSYLQKRSSGVNARIINRSVNLARKQPTIDSGDLEPPLNRLTSEQPCIPVENVDITRRPLAFGRRAMPKLRIELQSKDPLIVMQAITSVMDLVHNPERGYEAVRLKVPDRIAELLIHPHAAIRERACMALTVLAGTVDGTQSVARNSRALTNLAMLLDDVDGEVRIKVAACLEIIARFWMSADELIDFGFLPLLLDCICKDDVRIVSIHLETLHSLMYGCAGINEALETDAYTTLVALLESDYSDLRSSALKCLMRLLSTPDGKQLAHESNLLPDLNRLLHDERPDVYTSAASVIMFATIKTAAKIKATRIKHLPDRLVALSNDRHNPSAQIYCIKALTNICEHPEVRKYVSEKYLKEIENIEVGDDEDLKSYKKILLRCVNWQPYMK